MMSAGKVADADAKTVRRCAANRCGVYSQRRGDVMQRGIVWRGELRSGVWGLELRITEDRGFNSSRCTVECDLRQVVRTIFQLSPNRRMTVTTESSINLRA